MRLCGDFCCVAPSFATVSLPFWPLCHLMRAVADLRLFRKTYNLFGLPTAINVAFWLTKRYGIKANSFLLRCGFFVCAFHVCYLHQGNLLTKSTNLCKHILNGVPHMDAVQYLLPPFICIGICMLVFYLLQKNAPTVCNILTGNRATTNNNRK